jgi:hypothetical protein
MGYYRADGSKKNSAEQLEQSLETTTTLQPLRPPDWYLYAPGR